MKKEDHYKNNPNDSEPTIAEKKVSSRYNKLKHKFKVTSINSTISIRTLTTQCNADRQIKEMMLELYPEEFKIALKAAGDKYGYTKKRPERREEIIQSMNLKDRNILRKRK